MNPIRTKALWLKKKTNKCKVIVKLLCNKKALPSEGEIRNLGLPPSTIMTAVQRVDRAQDNSKSKDTSVEDIDGSKQVIIWKSDQGHQVLVNRTVSVNLLHEYEGLRSTDTEFSSSSWRLEKPDKSDDLLKFALTNVNGDVWKRQRPIIQRAFAVSHVRLFVMSAARKSLHKYLLEQRNLQNTREDSESALDNVSMPLPIQLDARHLSRNLAIDTMAIAVVSSKYASQLRDHLEPLYGISLTTNRQQKSERHILKQVVISILEDMILARQYHGKESQSKQPCCFAESLLVYYRGDSDTNNNSSSKVYAGEMNKESDDSDDEDDENYKSGRQVQYLTFDEVVCNCHSALLAGIQSIATILTGALAHLAEHHEYQEQCRTEAFTKTTTFFAKSIVNETIRILPPVATLPRQFVCPSHQLKYPGQQSLVSIGTTQLSTAKRTHIDILAIAHSTANNIKESTSLKSEFSTWKFRPSGKVSKSDQGRQSLKPSLDPMVPKRPDKNACAAPWGLGSRSCPAGALSVEVIAEVLQELTRSTYEWTFWNPAEHVTCPTGRNGWVSQVSYQPTLCYPQPLLLRIVPNNSMVSFYSGHDRNTFV
jgi:hypothetical protein